LGLLLLLSEKVLLTESTFFPVFFLIFTEALSQSIGVWWLANVLTGFGQENIKEHLEWQLET